MHRLQGEDIEAVIGNNSVEDLRRQLRIGAGLGVGLRQAADEALPGLVLLDRQPQRGERLIERAGQGKRTTCRAEVQPSPGRDRREAMPLDHDPGPHGRLEAAEAGEHRIGIRRQGGERIARRVGRRPRVIHAVDAIAEAEDFSRRVGGVAPSASRLEIAPADVPGLEVTEDDQRRLWRGGWRLDRGRLDRGCGLRVARSVPMLGRIECRNISRVARYGSGWRPGSLAQ